MFVKLYDTQIVTKTTLHLALPVKKCEFLGLLLISGYHNVPNENDYWSTADDLAVPIFGSVMNRERFRTLKRYFHLVDNQNLSTSKVAKVAPYYTYLCERFQQFGVFHQIEH